MKEDLGGVPQLTFRLSPVSQDVSNRLDEEYSKPKIYNDLKNKIEKTSYEEYKTPNAFIKWKRNILDPISMRLKRFTPKFKKVLRDFDYFYAMKKQKRIEDALPFIEKFSKLDPEQKENLDLALKNGDVEGIVRLVELFDMVSEYSSVKATLEEIYDDAKASGMEIGHIDEYFPRKIIPSEVGKVRSLLYNVPEFKSLID